METEKHVLDPIREIKNTNRRSPARFGQRVEEHLLAFHVDVLGLAEKCVLTNDALVQSGRVLRDPERREGTLLLRQVNRVGDGMRDRQGRAFRIDLDGRDVKPHVWFLLEQQKPGDGLDRESHGGLVTERHPGRVFVLPEFECLIRKLEFHGIRSFFCGDNQERDC